MRDFSSEQLARMKLPELRGLAKEMALIGYGRLRKADLIAYLLREMRAEALHEATAAAERSAASPVRASRKILEPPSAAPTPASSSIVEEAPAATAPREDSGSMRDADWYPPELPETYGKDRLTLMVRDPHWLFCYWEVGEALLAAARAELGDTCWRVLRVHLLGGSDEVIDGWEHGLGEEAVSWYLRTGRPGARFRVELGLRDSEGRYRALVASRAVTAPMDTPSERWDEEWVGLSRDAWEELERAARPYPASMSGAEAIKRELRSVASARIGSEGFFDGKNPGASKNKKASTAR